MAKTEGIDLRRDKESNIEKIIDWAEDEKNKIAEVLLVKLLWFV